MAEYISKEAVNNLIEDMQNNRFLLVCERTNLCILKSKVAELPATDVQPVKHGRWECVGHDDTTYWYRCSVCGHEEHDNMTKHDNYCGSCGARMDGDSE